MKLVSGMPGHQGSSESSRRQPSAAHDEEQIDTPKNSQTEQKARDQPLLFSTLTRYPAATLCIRSI